MIFIQRMQDEDKAQHLICAFLSVVLLLPWLDVLSAGAVVFSLGLVKEGWDYTVGSGFCWYDIAANTLGIVLAMICVQAPF